MMTALGFIETLGLLPAIEAADAMLKAADVRLVEKSLASGGLVTITVTGEVAAVQAAVDAGAASVGRIQGATLVSRHVIARPDQELEKIFTAKFAAKITNAKAVSAKEAKAPAAPAAVQDEAAAAAPAPAAPPAEAAPEQPAGPAPKKASKKASPKKRR